MSCVSILVWIICSFASGVTGLAVEEEDKEVMKLGLELSAPGLAIPLSRSQGGGELSWGFPGLSSPIFMRKIRREDKTQLKLFFTGVAIMKVILILVNICI